jgi:hypothetical protein
MSRKCFFHTHSTCVTQSLSKNGVVYQSQASAGQVVLVARREAHRVLGYRHLVSVDRVVWMHVTLSVPKCVSSGSPSSKETARRGSTAQRFTTPSSISYKLSLECLEPHERLGRPVDSSDPIRNIMTDRPLRAQNVALYGLENIDLATAKVIAQFFQD